MPCSGRFGQSDLAYLERDIMPTHSGGCHCGAVTFEFDAPDTVTATDCNCSICALTGHQHVFAAHEDFRLLSGQDALSEYQFGSKTARHLFCKHCGVKAFYQPRSHPDRYSINLKAIKPGTLTVSDFIIFDGQNWEDNIHQLRSH